MTDEERKQAAKRRREQLYLAYLRDVDRERMNRELAPLIRNNQRSAPDEQ